MARVREAQYKQSAALASWALVASLVLLPGVAAAADTRPTFAKSDTQAGLDRGVVLEGSGPMIV